MIESVRPVEDIGFYEKRMRVRVKGHEDRRVPVSGEGTYGYRTERGEPFEREEIIELEINLFKIICELGRKAIANKSGKSHDGHVKVRHVRQKS